MPPIRKATNLAAQNIAEHVIAVAAPAELPRIADEHRVRISEEALMTHTISPPHTHGVISSKGLMEGPALAAVPHLDRAARLLRFDDEAFANDLHANLKDDVAGYVMQLRRKGKTIRTLQWNWARQSADGGEGWTPTVRMHVASVSKLVTAMAMTRLLHTKKIKATTAIAPYLPTYWAKGPNIDKITFRHLMTHTSGFSTGGSSSDYAFMKSQVAAGVTNANFGQYDYENMNFGLCRILLATINGNLAPGTQFNIGFLPGGGNDLFWDALTIGAYRDYCEDHLFAPAGVSGPTFDHPSDDALAYRFPANAAGWNSGDLQSMSGGAGWHMSVDDLLDVMGAFRRGDTIVQSAIAQGMLDDGYGIDLVLGTGLGTLYNKNGRWQDGAGNVEQSLAYFLPGDMELVVLVNSPIGTGDRFMRTVVTDIITANIKPRKIALEARPKVLQP